VASKYLPEDTTYRAVQYGQDPPLELIEDRDVYILDFSYKRTKMVPIIELANSLVCLDHHRSAEAELADLPGCEFDMDRSGCRMTWDYFGRRRAVRWSPDEKEFYKRLDQIVDYVQDRDLWKFELPNSRMVNAAIRSYELDFAIWDMMTDRGYLLLSEQGFSILRNEQRQVELILRNARQVTLGGHLVWAVNTPILQSECAGELAERPISLVQVTDGNGNKVKTGVDLDGDPLFGIAWFQRDDGKIVVNLRSRGDFDVSELAQRFGGGGHKGAAGFEVEYDDAWGSDNVVLTELFGFSCIVG